MIPVSYLDLINLNKFIVNFVDKTKFSSFTPLPNAAIYTENYTFVRLSSPLFTQQIVAWV